MTKTAVVLFNLGGPDCPEAVQPFLFNLFYDPQIFRLPNPMRWLLAKLVSSRRAPIAAEIYHKLGGKSPIVPNTQAQARALEAVLNDAGDGEYKCFIAMRYWHPFAFGAAQAVKNFAPDRVVLLPLYPQYSTTTTLSSLRDWQSAAKKVGLVSPSLVIEEYPREEGFITALADGIRPVYESAQKFGKPRLLLSAHGLPEKIIKAGDPYQKQCEDSAAAVIQKLAIADLDCVLCYQSRVGPLKWIGPSTEEEVKRAGAEKRPLVIAPLAFVSDHSETLVEIDMEYRDLAEKTGVPAFFCIPAVGVAEPFIAGLARLVQTRIAKG